jgi:hypothetical protein
MHFALILRADACFSFVIPDGSRRVFRARRADPGPRDPGVRKGTAGVHGSRLSCLTALGQDDNRKFFEWGACR